MVNLIGKITIVYLARKCNYISSAHNKCILLRIPISRTLIILELANTLS